MGKTKWLGSFKRGTLVHTARNWQSWRRPTLGLAPYDGTTFDISFERTSLLMMLNVRVKLVFLVNETCFLIDRYSSCEPKVISPWINAVYLTVNTFLVIYLRFQCMFFEDRWHFNVGDLSFRMYVTNNGVFIGLTNYGVFNCLYKVSTYAAVFRIHWEETESFIWNGKLQSFLF